MRSLLRLIPALALLLAPIAIRSQGTKADYDRAQGLRQRTENKVFKTRLQAHWFDHDSRFWYRNDLANGAREFVVIEAEKGIRERAFDHQRVAAGLADKLGREVKPDHLPIETLEFDNTGTGVILRGRDQSWQCDLRTYALVTVPAPADSTLPRLLDFHPSRRTGEETAITFLNQTKADVKVFWIDSAGERRPYGSVAAGAQRQQHTFAGHVWLLTDPDGKVLDVFEATAEPGLAVIQDSERPKSIGAQRKTRARRPRSEHESKDGRWAAFVKDCNVYVRDLQTTEQFALSTDGCPDDPYTGEFWWSPDSQHLVAMRTRKGDDRKVYYVESSPKDQLQPKLHSYEYLKPGDRIPLPKPHLFHVTTRQQAPISEELFPNPWSITELRWSADSKAFTFLYNQRGHQVLRVVAVDAESGQARLVVEEKSATFIDYEGKLYLHPLESTHELIWMSERDGWNHLYLYDSATGAVKNQITRGPWVVRAVDRVDADQRLIWFRAGGIHPAQDPYYVHFCRINFDGSGLTVLTEGDGNHSVEFSLERRFFIDSCSRVDLPPVHELRRASDGQRVCELERADWTELLGTGWSIPERFAAKGRDGQTDIYGVIIRPTNFDPKRRYPVIENIYAGPQSAYVPKTFSSYYAMQSLAELGFIVVQIDGMGTSQRSKAFHDVCWKNLGDAGFPDRILWIKEAARKYPYMDLDRIGIYGGSAGGQSSTRALLAYGDFYRVAVSDCGCHDNRMDKIWWNELWMGWPIGPEYEAQSNVIQAHHLQGHLLLMVGEMDENVDPSSTLQVVNALIKADKDFDLLVMPGRGHGSAESEYGRRRRADFFVRHLLGVEPRNQPPTRPVAEDTTTLHDDTGGPISALPPGRAFARQRE